MSETSCIKCVGCPKKYYTEEEKYIAFREQQNKYLRRKRKEQTELRKTMSEKQKELIKYLQQNVIKNEQLLDLINTRIKNHRLGLIEEILDLPCYKA